MKNYLRKIKLSQKARKLFLLNLSVIIFSIVVVLSIISYFGLGRGEVGVFLINFSEKDISVTLDGNAQTLSMFDILSLELNLSKETNLIAEGINLNLQGGNTPKLYAVISGNDVLAPFCLAKTLLNNSRSAISAEFDIIASTPSKAHQFSFTLPLEQIWWPGKSSKTANQNLSSDYVFVFPFDCKQNTEAQLAEQAKFWLEYTKESQLNFYNQQVLELQNNNAYNDPGPT